MHLYHKGSPNGGAKGIRTPDLFHAMEARYQLRHSPLRLDLYYSDPFFSANPAAAK